MLKREKCLRRPDPEEDESGEVEGQDFYMAGPLKIPRSHPMFALFRKMTEDIGKRVLYRSPLRDRKLEGVISGLRAWYGRPRYWISDDSVDESRIIKFLEPGPVPVQAPEPVPSLQVCRLLDDDEED